LYNFIDWLIPTSATVKVSIFPERAFRSRQLIERREGAYQIGCLV
jgi:hypothetical protein